MLVPAFTTPQLLKHHYQYCGRDRTFALVQLRDACQENSRAHPVVNAMPPAVEQVCDDHLGHNPACKVLMGFYRPAGGYGRL